jgi:hypothetical protein
MKKVLLIFVLPLIIFWPSFFVFFTNDDFFFLKIANANSLNTFLDYFNFTGGPDGFGMYRPITTQVFYSLGNPVLMHSIVFGVFLAILYTLYLLGIKLFKNEKIALISVFLYSVSATHFGHFYYLATFQELGMTLFVLLSIYTFLCGKHSASIIFFVLALLSKETAVITPCLIFLNEWYVNRKVNYKKYIFYFLILGIYLFIHFYIYGLAAGDTYIWNFGFKKLLNTVMWYLIWALNLPETLVDFVGPGLSLNPNLFLYWKTEIIPILILFCTELVFLIFLMLKYLEDTGNKNQSFFAMIWFGVTLLPVIFLPVHKFTFYLTLPLVAVIFRIAYLLEKNKSSYVFIYFFLLVWTSLSILTLKHTINTSWVTSGEKISQRVYNYFKMSDLNYASVSFIDTEKDVELPWSPTQVVKTALSDRNFFYVYYPSLADSVYYGDNGNPFKISSRTFLGY